MFKIDVHKLKSGFKSGVCFKCGWSPVQLCQWINGAWLCLRCLTEAADSYESALQEAQDQGFHDIRECVSCRDTKPCTLGKWTLCGTCQADLQTGYGVAKIKMWPRETKGQPPNGNKPVFDELPESFFEPEENAVPDFLEGQFAIGVQNIGVGMPAMASAKSIGFPTDYPGSSNSVPVNWPGSYGETPAAKFPPELLDGIQTEIKLAQQNKPKAKHLIIAAIASGKKLVSEEDGETKLKTAQTGYDAGVHTVWVYYKVKIDLGTINLANGQTEWAWSHETLEKVKTANPVYALKPVQREHAILNAAREHVVKAKQKEYALGKFPCFITGYAWLDPEREVRYTRKLKEPYCYG